MKMGSQMSKPHVVWKSCTSFHDTRRKLLDIAHKDFGHPSTQNMLNVMPPNYYSHNMTQGVSQYVSQCDVCQKQKIK